jgi:hypothetical protein
MYNLVNGTNLVHNFFLMCLCFSLRVSVRPAYQTVIHIEWQIPGVA